MPSVALTAPTLFVSTRRAMVISLLVAGCGPAVVPTVELSGAVAYDGQAVPQGSISFVPADGAGAPALLAITDGRYAGRVPAGNKRIEIRGLRPAARARPSTGGPGGEAAEAVESFIPSKYNDQSGLSREIAPPGPLTIDFALEK